MSTDGDLGHGNSPAAWTTVTIILLAFVIGTVAFWLDAPIFVWASAGLVLVGVIVGVVMAKLGYGVRGPKFVAKAHN